MGIGNIANSGMQASMASMDVISNNIANANTYGFKKSYINFADLFPANGGVTSSGLGVSVTSIRQSFETGGVDATGNPLDFAIAKNGFFVTANPTSGQVSYTRMGRFNFSEDGYIVNSAGQRLQGFPAIKNQILPGSLPVDLQVSTDSVPANATTEVNSKINLDSTDTAPTSPFDPNDETTYNFRIDPPIFDSLGNSTNLTLYFVKSATANTWTVNAQIDGTIVGTGTATFSTSGALTGLTGLNALSYAPTTGAQSPQVFAVNLTGSTQYAGESEEKRTTQDGYKAGTASGYEIDTSGIITVIYSNQERHIAGQIALASFPSEENLQNIGNMSWVETSASGTPLINQKLSQDNILVGNLELSNVDLTEEMVNLIGAQHSFQANAQVEQVFNEVMQTILQV